MPPKLRHQPSKSDKAVRDSAKGEKKEASFQNKSNPDNENDTELTAAAACLVSAFNKNKYKPPKTPSPSEIQSTKTNREREALFSWYVLFNQLYRYAQVHNNPNVPQKWGKLGTWVNKQRQQYSLFQQGKRSNLSQIKIFHLEAIGFKW